MNAIWGLILLGVAFWLMLETKSAYIIGDVDRMFSAGFSCVFLIALAANWFNKDEK